MNMNHDCLRPPNEQEGTFSQEDTPLRSPVLLPKLLPQQCAQSWKDTWGQIHRSPFSYGLFLNPGHGWGPDPLSSTHSFKRKFSMKSTKSVTVNRLALYRIIDDCPQHWRLFISLWVCLFFNMGRICGFWWWFGDLKKLYFGCLS